MPLLFEQLWWYQSGTQALNIYMTPKQFVEKAIEGGWRYDKADLPLLSKHSWNVTEKGYLITTIKYKQTRMHHLIMGKPAAGVEIDHINHNPKDNRRSNLRFVTRSQNHYNRSNVKGYRKRGEKWDAQIMVAKKQIHLGTFKSEKEAKDAYKKAKVTYHKI